MTMPGLPYGLFTSEERIRLTLMAATREDWTELKVLAATCPSQSRVGPHMSYSLRFLRLTMMVQAVLSRWVEASAWCLATGSGVAVGGGRSTDALWKQASASWRGIEEGIKKFCGETNLTYEQLFVVVGGQPAVIELTTSALHPKARPNAHWARNVHQWLSDAWRDPAEIPQEEMQNNFLGPW